MTIKVLVVSPACPVPATAGAPLRVSGWLRAAAPTVEFAVATLVRSPSEGRALAELREWAAHVVAVPAPRTALRRLRDRGLAALTGRPHGVVANTNRELLAAADRLMKSWSPDVVQFEELSATPYLRIAHHGRCATIYSAHNVESLVAAGPPAERGSWSARVRARRLRELETTTARSVDRVVAVTLDEASWFEQRGATAVHIPNALWLDRFPLRRELEPSGRPTMLFVGHLAYPPNRDAAVRLVRDILPRVKSVVPHVRCVIAGRRPASDVRRLSELGAEILADRADLSDVWDAASVFVCPLRWGGGSRLKLIEAAARGVPVVTTRVGAGGLDLRAGVDIVIADDDAEMATAVLDTLGPSGDVSARVASARRRVETHHDWGRLAPRIHELYESLSDHHRS